MEKVFQTYGLKQWQSWLLERHASMNSNGVLEGRVCRIVEMFLNPQLEKYRKSADHPVLPDNGYERLRCLTCYAVCLRTVFSSLPVFAESADPDEKQRNSARVKEAMLSLKNDPEAVSRIAHEDHRRWREQAEHDLFPDDARLVTAVLRPYPFCNRDDIQATMMRIAFLSSEQAVKASGPNMELELKSLLRYVDKEFSGDCRQASLTYNELSALGLVYKINKEVLHPLGLALHYNVDDGVSEGVYISPDRVYEYSEETSREEEEKLHRFLKNRHQVLDKLELEKQE